LRGGTGVGDSLRSFKTKSEIAMGLASLKQESKKTLKQGEYGMCEDQDMGIRVSGSGMMEPPPEIAVKQAEVRSLDVASGIAGIPVTDKVAKDLEEGNLPK
jgi:hypothetical protein